MHSRYALTLRTQLGLPLVPFAIDLGARTFILWDKVAWYQLPDLWTLLVTYAFFCLGLMVTVRAPTLPTDPEAETNAEIVRQRLLGYAIVSVALAGAISVYRAIDELIPDQHFSLTRGLPLIVVVAIFVGYTFTNICRIYASYVTRGA